MSSPAEGDDLRAGGHTLEEMLGWATGGDLNAAPTSQNALGQLSTSLREVAQTIRTPLAQLGTSWQGHAADAAKAGIGQHVQWAETASAQMHTMAGEVGQYGNSASTVAAQVEELWTKAQAVTAVGHGGPGGLASAAGGEQATAEATRAAQELFQRHWGLCRSATPQAAISAPPGAGGPAKVPATGDEAVAGGGKSVHQPAGAGTGLDDTAGGGPGRTSSAGATEGMEYPTVKDGPVAGTGGSPDGHSPGAGGVVAAAGPGYQPGTRGPSWSYGDSSGDPMIGGYDEGGPAGGLASGEVVGGGVYRDGVVPAGGVLGTGPTGETYRPTKRRAAKDRLAGPGMARVAGHVLPAQDAPVESELAGPTDHGHRSGLSGGPMMSPGMLGGMASNSARRDQRHTSPEYLVDEDDLFNGEDWLAPPVIGR